MVETIRVGAVAPGARVAVFDFDGTVSLIRSGWMDIMVPMMVSELAALGTGETGSQLRNVVEPFIWRQTGKDTLYQMISLTVEIARRGGVPRTAAEYKQQFLDQLLVLSGQRMDEIRRGIRPPDDYLVPGTRAMLAALRRRGLQLYLASGTDDVHLQEEAELLDIARYFDGGVYGALPDPDAFSKRLLLEKILSRDGMRPEHVIGFGDGPVEIEELKRAGAVAVGLATSEPECRQVNAWKRQNLIEIGADYIIANYLDAGELSALVLNS